MPTVTIVFLVFNRREELQTSLTRMLEDSDFPAELVDVVVVDNASEDGSAEMVAEVFPQVQVIRREVNCGVSGWNDGFAVARGDYVLALDDDCYLPPDGLRHAVDAAQQHDADLVSFSVRSLQRPEFRFTDAYITGLLAFWGCAVLVRRPALERLRGYDPEIFVWANELEFMLRFFDHGFRHLHLPEVIAVHMKDPGDEHWTRIVRHPSYRINAQHFMYIAAKLLRPRDALGAVVAVATMVLREGIQVDPVALKALPPAGKGLLHGIRHRKSPVSADVSHAYRCNFHSFASPWWFARPLPELVRSLPGELTRRVAGHHVTKPPGRRDQYFSERGAFYPASAATLEFSLTGADKDRGAAPPPGGRRAVRARRWRRRAA